MTGRGWKRALVPLALALCLVGCAPGGGRVLDVSGERQALDEAVNGLFAALDARDGEAVAALFSPEVREKDEDLEEQIRQLLAVYPGPTERYDLEYDGGAKQRSGGSYYNTTACTVYATCGGEDYWCWFTLMYQNSDPEKVGVKSIRFFTAEEYCGVCYDDWEIPAEDGLAVYAQRTLDCEVRAIRGDAYKYTPPEAPLDLGEVEAFLSTGEKTYDEFVARFGEPCAERIWYFYQLPPEDGAPRYLRMIVDYNDKTVSGFCLVDDTKWLGRLFEEEEPDPPAAKE